MKKLMVKLKGEAELVGANMGKKTVKVEHAAKGAKKGAKRAVEDLVHGEPSTQKQLERGLEDMFDEMTQGAEKLKAELSPGYVQQRMHLKRQWEEVIWKKPLVNWHKNSKHSNQVLVKNLVSFLTQLQRQ